MEKKLSWWWEFTVAGLIVAVIALVGVNWYNHGKMDLKDRQITNDLKLETYLRGQIADLNHANDSLYKANDSLMRRSIYFRYSDGREDTISFGNNLTVKPFAVTGIPITHSGKLYITDTTRKGIVDSANGYWKKKKH